MDAGAPATPAGAHRRPEAPGGSVGGSAFCRACCAMTSALTQTLKIQCPSIFTIQSPYMEDVWQFVAASPLAVGPEPQGQFRRPVQQHPCSW